MKISRAFTIALGLFLSAIIAFAVGCRDARPVEVQKRRDSLTQLAETYLAFNEESDGAPTNVTEFLAFMDSLPASDSVASARESLEEGEVVVIWGGDLSDVTANPTSVLAFEARAPASGGYVVMADGQVQMMTGKDFSEATMLTTVNP